MNSEHWQKVKSIFDAVIELAPSEREKFLVKSCDGDDELRCDVEQLLASSDEAKSFMEKPAASEIASLIVEPKNLAAGTSFGHYEIVKQIGAGGMGEVYLAKDTKLERKVAVKILNEKFAAHESNLQRFIREAKAASALNHPNILVIHEIGASDNSNYIVSEFIEGETLREVIENSPLKLSEVLDISIQITNALCAAHEAHIVHRDIKPDNIMIRPDGFVKILDFGLAKLVEQKAVGLEAPTVKQNQTAKGVIMGTVNYMSPEQAKGEKIDARTDIFSFGVVLYEMIAGRTPFAGDSMSETFANLINSEPPPLTRFSSNVPDELNRIVAKTLRKKRDERYQTMKDLLIDLKNVRQELEFQNQLERTAAPQREKAETQSFNQTTADTRHTTSSAEYLIGEIKSRRRGFAVGLLVVLLASIGLGYWFFANRSSNAAIESIAVLPFENASGDADLDYLSDGLSESLIDRLSELPQLKVIARSSSFKFRSNTDVQDVARKLDVQAIIMGKVIRRGDDLTIRIELIDTRENVQLWGEQFDRKATDAITIQREIAQMVSGKLRLKLSGAQEQKLAKHGTDNPQAYELLLKGDFLVQKNPGENMTKAIEYYEQATILDPNYALAFARLSRYYQSYAANSILDPKDMLPKARTAAQKAIELDENLAEAHIELARLALNDWDWRTAEREFLRALELNPNLVTAHNRYGTYLSAIGRHEQAIAEAYRVKELNPQSLNSRLGVPYALVMARKFDESIAETKKILELDQKFSPAYLVLGFAFAGKGMYKQAIAAYQESKQYGNTELSLNIYLGAGYARAGEREKAQEILKQLETSDKYVSPGELAVLYAALGEREKAFASLEKAYAAHDLQLQSLKIDSGFDSLRYDPRFQDLLRRVGLPQ